MMAVKKEHLIPDILEKANIPVNLSTPMVFSRKNKKEQPQRTKKKGGSLRTISRKKINPKKEKLTSLKHKSNNF